MGTKEWGQTELTPFLAIKQLRLPDNRIGSFPPSLGLLEGVQVYPAIWSRHGYRISRIYCLFRRITSAALGGSMNGNS